MAPEDFRLPAGFEGPQAPYVHAYGPAAPQGGAEGPGPSASTYPDGNVNCHKAKPCLTQTERCDVVQFIEQGDEAAAQANIV
jgi:hypothetical protein